MKNSAASAGVRDEADQGGGEPCTPGLLASRRLTVSAVMAARRPASAKKPVATIARGEKARPTRIQPSAKQNAIAAPKARASSVR
jgi:hypothetical protein